MKKMIIAIAVILMTLNSLTTEAAHPRFGHRPPMPPQVIVVHPQQPQYYGGMRYGHHAQNRGQHHQLMRMAAADGVITPRERMILQQNYHGGHHRNCR